MTDPNQTNEEVNEELSTDDLKSVSGGLSQVLGGDCSAPSFTRTQDDSSQGSGYGGTLKDWKKRNKTGVVILGSSDL